MPNNRPNLKADLRDRLHCAQGHLRGIVTMIQRDDGCKEVVCQLSAVQGALCEVERRLIQHYLDACLRQGLREPDRLFRDRYIDEVMTLYQMLGVGKSGH